MSLWSTFKESLESIKSPSFSSRLHQKISDNFPNKDDEFHLKAACLSGLMARIAYADLKIDSSEKETISQSLITWMEMNETEANNLADLCLEEIKDLAGIENHLYCLPLRESLSVMDRYKIIETLFAVAAADGNVENLEGEEIRNINQGLLLEHKHFISARSTVLEHLGSLKKD